MTDCNNIYFHSSIVLRIPLKPTNNPQKLIFDKIEWDQQMKEAIYVASPELYEEFEKKQSTNFEDEKLKYTLLKYYQRMCYRCTPFGLFARLGVGSWQNDNSILISNYFNRSTRLDMEFVIPFIRNIEKISSLKRHLLYFSNTSIYKFQKKVRYTEIVFKDGNRTFQLSQIEKSELVSYIIDFTENGKKIDAIILAVKEKFDVEKAGLSSFIDELINNQILVSELLPKITEISAEKHLLNSLERINSTAKLQELNDLILELKKIVKLLTRLDKSSDNLKLNYQVLFSKLEKFEVRFNKNKVIQVDSFIHGSSSISISKKHQKKLINAISILSKIQPFYNFNLDQFKQRFNHRYESKALPLVQVLDPEYGIGYGLNSSGHGDLNKLMLNLNLKSKIESRSIKWNEKEEFLLKKLNETINNNRYSLLLEEKDIPYDFANSSINFPTTTSVIFSILNDDKESKLHLKGVMGSSATNLLGRFALKNDKINSLCNEIIDFEEKQYENAILAEIVHLPENRAGNIILRPKFRKHEIAYLVTGSQDTISIKLDDLLVKVINNEVILWSIKLQSRIIPRMSNAHNFGEYSLPIYQFLCDLQTQNETAELFFSWGKLSNFYQFLPRVEIGNVIVQPATWRFKKIDFDCLVNSNDNNFSKIFQNWKNQWNLPDRIYLTEGDNILYLNLEDPESDLVKLFISEIKKRNEVIITEFLFDMENPLVKDSNNHGFSNEIIATLFNTDKVENKLRSVESEKFQEFLMPGSNWMYYKFYLGYNSAEEFLVSEIKPYLDSLVKEKKLNSWFFIRYSDPEFHLRIRLNISDDDFKVNIIQEIKQLTLPYINSGIIWKVQIDTYLQELDRYGIANIENLELMFFNDSIYVTCLLKKLNSIKGSYEMRLLSAFYSVNKILDDFSFDINSKLEILSRLISSFESEYVMNKAVKKKINKRYRQYSLQINEIMKNGFVEIENLIRRWSKNNEKLIAQTIKNCDEDPFSNSLDEIVSSYIHMHLNRLLRSNHRITELIIYKFLYKYIKSLAARKKLKNAQIQDI